MKARLFNHAEWRSYQLAKAARRARARLIKCRSRPSLRRKSA